MEESILNGTKKILGLPEDYTAFDHDVITHINAAFGTLNQLGLGDDGFMIEDDEVEWDDFLEGKQTILNVCKTYIYLRVRLLFDPPTTSYAVEAAQKQVDQLEWRLNSMREQTDYTPPVSEEA